MTAQADVRATPAEYFRADERSPARLEFFRGMIVAQAGSTARHNTIVSNIIGTLFPVLRARGCRIFASAMRVQAIDQVVYTYPDLTIVCGAGTYLEATERTLLDPIVIIEILSPSTEVRDRREKLPYYRNIESLQAYLLIDQFTPYVQSYTRQTAHFWFVHLTDDLDGEVALDAVGATLPMRAIYDGVTLEHEE